jgi:hypothetical protein
MASAPRAATRLRYHPEQDAVIANLRSDMLLQMRDVGPQAGRAASRRACARSRK